MQYDPDLTWPPPWWLDYLLDAEAAHCSPWGLFDTWTPKAFWIACIRHLRHGRGIANQKKSHSDDQQIEKIKKDAAKKG